MASEDLHQQEVMLRWHRSEFRRAFDFFENGFNAVEELDESAEKIINLL